MFCLKKKRNKILKKLISFTFLAIIISLIFASLFSQEFSRRYFYQALWFKGFGFIAVIGVVTAIVNSIKRKDFGLAIVCFGVFIILSAAFLTSLFGEEGFIDIKEGQSMNGFWVEDNLFRPFNFSLSLKHFYVEFYPESIKGERSAKSYKTSVSINDGKEVIKEGVIEVNRPLSFRGFSFYQYGYDAGLPHQTILQVVKDPGLPVVYFGYFMLLLGMALSFKRVWNTI